MARLTRLISLDDDDIYCFTYPCPHTTSRTLLAFEESHELFMKLSQKYDVFRPLDQSTSTTGVERTRFTTKNSNGVHAYAAIRPALVVSSTSWTEDEDFSMLLNALEGYEATCCDVNTSQNLLGRSLPHVVCVITGKGPMKTHYLQEISKRTWSYVQFCTPWLEPEDYPVLLGSANLGVCLHTSSSGLDLPMKVVDMFGSGLPVCAVSFKCLGELVKHDKNGMIFHCANELNQQLQQLLNGFPDQCSKLKVYKENVKQFQALRWHQCWKSNVLPMFE